MTEDKEVTDTKQWIQGHRVNLKDKLIHILLNILNIFSYFWLTSKNGPCKDFLWEEADCVSRFLNALTLSTGYIRLNF